MHLQVALLIPERAQLVGDERLHFLDPVDF
jgi:hypothetical protein